MAKISLIQYITDYENEIGKMVTQKAKKGTKMRPLVIG